MTLSENIKDWLLRLEELLTEGRRLEQEITEVERQNRFLHTQLAPDSVRGNGMEALSALYDDGFHICHANFARSREGEDCLFCLSFLHKEGVGK